MDVQYISIESLDVYDFIAFQWAIITRSMLNESIYSSALNTDGFSISTEPVSFRPYFIHLAIESQVNNKWATITEMDAHLKPTKQPELNQASGIYILKVKLQTHNRIISFHNSVIELFAICE